MSVVLVLTVSLYFQVPVQPAGSAADDASSRPASSPPRPVSPLRDHGLLDEPVPASTTRKKWVVLDLHTRLSPHFPAHFHHDEVVAPYFYVADDSLREKFKAPTFGSVSLDLQVFDKGEVSVGSSPLALQEAHLRAALLEC